jgi:hypothetical protein
MKYLIGVFLILSVFFFSGCSARLHPQIKVSQGNNSLRISGAGFSNTNPCAHLSIIGLPPPFAGESIGDPACLGGIFTNFPWQYADTGCTATTSTQVVILGIDKTTSNPASQGITLRWSPACGVAGICGVEGQPACPGNVCKAGLNPNGSVCTATCGHVHQPACVTDGSELGVTSVFHCYNRSIMDNDCACVFDPNPNPCQEINSGNTGVCQPIIRIPPPGQASCR